MKLAACAPNPAFDLGDGHRLGLRQAPEQQRDRRLSGQLGGFFAVGGDLGHVDM